MPEGVQTATCMPATRPRLASTSSCGVLADRTGMTRFWMLDENTSANSLACAQHGLARHPRPGARCAHTRPTFAAMTGSLGTSLGPYLASRYLQHQGHW